MILITESHHQFKAGNIRGSGGVLPPTKEQTKEAETNIEQSVSGLVETSEKLEQDDMEGVDDNEWGEDFQNIVMDLVLVSEALEKYGFLVFQLSIKKITGFSNA